MSPVFSTQAHCIHARPTPSPLRLAYIYVNCGGLDDLCGSRVLAVGAAHFLGACSFLAWLVFDCALDLLDRAFHLVLQGGLSLVVRVGSALLGDAGASLLGGRGLGLEGSLALARRLGGNGGKDTRLGVAGRASGLGHGLVVLG
jgi:hypothetical protein